MYVFPFLIQSSTRSSSLSSRLRMQRLEALLYWLEALPADLAVDVDRRGLGAVEDTSCHLVNMSPEEASRDSLLWLEVQVEQ